MRLIVLSLVIIFSTISYAEVGKIRLARDCEVKEGHLDDSKIACSKKAGEILDLVSEMASGFFVQSVECFGYLPKGCAEGFEEQTSRQTKATKNEFRRSWTVGFLTSAELPRGEIKDDAKGASGFGFTVGGILHYRFAEKFRASLSLIRHGFQLERTVGGASGPFETPVVKYKQSLSFLGVGLTGGYYLEDRNVLSHTKWPFTLWLEGGFEYMVPLSATQEGPDGTVDFKTPGRPLLGLVGISCDIPIGGALSIYARLQGFMNLTTTSNAKYMGARLSAAIDWDFI